MSVTYLFTLDTAGSMEVIEEARPMPSVRWMGSRRRRTIILPHSMATSASGLVDNEEIDTGNDVAPPKYERQPSNDV